MENILRNLAQLTIRLLATPADDLRHQPETLVEIERLANQVLSEVAALRAAGTYLPGERSGSWRIQPHA